MPPKKNQDSTPIRNALTIFTLLLYSGRSYSLKELSELLACSRQSVMRILDQISSNTESYIYSWKENGQRYYKLATSEKRPCPILSEEEIEQMNLCREWLGGLLPQGMKDSLEHSTQKSSILLENFSRREELFPTHGQSISKGRIDYTPFEETLRSLISAARSHQVIIVSYQSLLHRTPHTHEIVAANLLAFREGLYVRGWKVTDKGFPKATSEIMLAVHRIQEVVFTQRFMPYEVFKALPQYKENAAFGFAQQVDPFTVRAIFFGGGAQYVAERIWSDDQKMLCGEDGSVELTLTAQSEMEVVKWILGFGADAQLLEPEHLRQRVLAEMRTAMARYKETQAFDTSYNSI